MQPFNFAVFLLYRTHFVAKEDLDKDACGRLSGNADSLAL